MDLMELREQINEIDSEMLKLFLRRMEVAENVAEYKRQNGLPVLDAERERELLANIAQQAGEDLDKYAVKHNVPVTIDGKVVIADRVVKTSCPHNCYDTCGELV